MKTFCKEEYLSRGESVQRLSARRFYGVRESVKRRTITKYYVVGCISTGEAGSEIPGCPSVGRMKKVVLVANQLCVLDDV